MSFSQCEKSIIFNLRRDFKMLSNEQIASVKNKIKKGESALIVLNSSGRILLDDKRTGVAAAIEFYQTQGQIPQDIFVFDKVVGKGAAAIFALCGAEYVYGQIMSSHAIDMFEGVDIDWECDKEVDVIIGKNNLPICPIEDCVLNIDDPNLTYEAILKKLKSLKNKG